MSRHCEVRYIITVNALKEGWDCPFAYILASLSNKSSRIDVEQILGRVLRMPYTSKADDPLLGLSYVFTASANFNDTLNAIVKSLNNSGYSSRDYKLGNNEPPKPLSSQPEQLKLDLENPNPIVPEEDDDSVAVHDIDVSQVHIQPCKASAYQMQQAISISKKYDEEIREIKDEVNDLPTDLISDNPNKSCIRPQFKDIAKTIKLPVFAVRAFSNNLFGSEESLEDLTPEMLVDDDFKLNMADCNIDYDKISAQAAQIDIDKVSDKDYTANYTLLKTEEKEYLRQQVEEHGAHHI
jgi:type III restriction enzyme